MSKPIPSISSKEINKTRLNYLLYDHVKSPTVVLLHATGFVPWLWHPIAEKLADRFQVIVPCLSSLREPDGNDFSISWELLAGDVSALLTSLDVEAPYLVGHSMGATIATLVHARYSLPVKKMILIEPIYLQEEVYGIVIPPEMHPMASKAIKRGNGWKDRDEGREYFLSRPFFQSWHQDIFELYLTYGLVENGHDGVLLYCSPEKEAALFLGSGGVNPWPYLPKVDCPVLVVEGETTENKAFIDYRKISQIFNQGEYLEVPGAGHLIPMEKPYEMLRIIDAYLQGSRKSG